MAGEEKERKAKRYAIIGAGPIGGIMGAYLAKNGGDVTLVDILQGHLNAIKVKGLRISGFTEMTVAFPLERLLYSIDDMEGKEFDAVFISIKASLLPKIMPTIAGVVKKGTTMVSLHNGLDTEELIAESMGREHTLRVVLNYAGNLVEDGHIRMNFFNPPNHIGGMDPASEKAGREIADVLNASGLETGYSADIKHYAWEKLILNLALAATCALTGKTMKEMMEFEPTRMLARDLMKEGIEVAAACGYMYGPQFLDQCMKWVDNTGYHFPSMAVDIQNKKPTEIDFLNGKVVEYGKAKIVNTPYNTAVTALVKGLEAPDRRGE